MEFEINIKQLEHMLKFEWNADDVKAAENYLKSIRQYADYIYDTPQSIAYCSSLHAGDYAAIGEHTMHRDKHRRELHEAAMDALEALNAMTQRVVNVSLAPEPRKVIEQYGRKTVTKGLLKFVYEWAMMHA
jgi:hypothetical protein